MKQKMDAGDKQRLETAVEEAIAWLDDNQLAEKDEFEHRKKELEQVANPIMQRMYQGATSGGGQAESPPGEPFVEEVDE